MMTSVRRFAAGVQAIVRDYPWKRRSRILDIGGASGSLLAAILSQPGSKSLGVLCDLPQVTTDPIFNYITAIQQQDFQYTCLTSIP